MSAHQLFTTGLPAWYSSQNTFNPVEGGSLLISGNGTISGILTAGSLVGPISGGAISCTSLTDTGTMSVTALSTMAGITCTSLLNSGTLSCGSHGATVGALSCTAITSSGTFSCAGNAATVGALSSLSVTTGSISATSLTDSGTLAVTGSTHLDNGHIATSGTGSMTLDGGIQLAGTLECDGSTILDNGAILTDGAGSLTITATLAVRGSSGLDNGNIFTDGLGGMTMQTLSVLGQPLLPSGAALGSTLRCSDGATGAVSWANYQPTNIRSSVSHTLNVVSDKMMGFGNLLQFTPTFSGKLKVMASSTIIGNNNTLTFTFYTDTVAHGVPANNAALPGTAQALTLFQTVKDTSTSYQMTIPTTGYITGLTVGTAYWFDWDCTVDANSITMSNLNVLIEEF